MKSILSNTIGMPALLLGAVLAPGAVMAQAVPPEVQKITVDEAKLRAHVINPPNVQGVTHSKGLEEGNLRYKLPKPASATPHLDVDAFGKALHAALKDSVAGYAMQLRKGGTTIYTLEWQWAQGPSDGKAGWNMDRQQHIASCSKLMTAMGTTKLLDAKGISYDAKIAGYLPTYWKKGPNVNKISFRNLMTHTSGFTTTATDYASMKAQVEQGVSTDSGAQYGLGKYKYANMNFGICRILISIIDGYVPKTMAAPDPVWDYVTINSYDHYMQTSVFKPAGAGLATMAHPSGDALAYQFPASDGWDSGDLSTVIGGAGWHMSVDEMLKVMGAFRRKGTIMSDAKAQEMMDNGFGLDIVAMNTPAGKLYNKNGLWADGNGHTEQSLAYFLPEDMEMVVLANSPVGSPAKFFRDVVTQCYLDHIK